MDYYSDRLGQRVFRTTEIFEICRRKIDNPYHFKTHGHEFYEIDIIISGNCDFVVNGLTYRQDTQSVGFVSPLDFHSLDSASGMEYYNIMFYGECISDKLMSLIHRKETPIMVKMSKETFGRIIVMCEMLAGEEKRNGYQKNHYSINLIECILIEILRANGLTTEMETNDNSAMDIVLRYIHENFQNRITLAEVASEIDISPNYMSKKFREYMGKRFQDYLSEIRCKHAKNLIRSTDKKLFEICFESGFNSFSQFERSFKKCCGMSAKTFRERLKNKEKKL